jgi:hypothetical protein
VVAALRHGETPSPYRGRSPVLCLSVYAVCVIESCTYTCQANVSEALVWEWYDRYQKKYLFPWESKKSAGMAESGCRFFFAGSCCPGMEGTTRAYPLSCTYHCVSCVACHAKRAMSIACQDWPLTRVLAPPSYKGQAGRDGRQERWMGRRDRPDREERFDR